MVTVWYLVTVKLGACRMEARIQELEAGMSSESPNWGDYGRRSVGGRAPQARDVQGAPTPESHGYVAARSDRRGATPHLDGEEHYVGRRELADLMGLHVRTIDKMVRAGMPSETWGRRTRRFQPSKAIAWAREQSRR